MSYPTRHCDIYLSSVTSLLLFSVRASSAATGTFKPDIVAAVAKQGIILIRECCSDLVCIRYQCSGGRGRGNGITRNVRSSNFKDSSEVAVRTATIPMSLVCFVRESAAYY